MTDQQDPVELTTKILKLIITEPGINPTAIADRLSIPVDTVVRLTQVLVKHNVLTLDEEQQ